MLDGFKVNLVPGGFPYNADLMDGNILGLSAEDVNRNGQPLLAMRRFDLVAVAPATLIVLYVIVKNEQVRPLDLIEHTASWNVGRLQDNGVHLSVVSCTTYGGRSMLRSNIRARYSPKMPSANNWAPLTRAIMEARNGKPGGLPAVK